jgi:hypothetical protein
MTKNRKKITAENFFKFFFYQKLHPTLQNMNFYKLLSTFWGHFALLDPDPDPYSGSGSTLPIEYGSNTDPDPDPYSGSGSTLPIEYGSNTDPDPQPWFFFHISSSFFTLDLGSAWDPGLTSRIIFIRAFY